MAKKRGLVIVESPAKARTLSNILGKDFDVRASVGHVRDLPKSRLGVDVENNFDPHYIVPKDKKAVVKDLKEAVSKADIVYLATDPDREGEAISWHLYHALELDGSGKPKKPAKAAKTTKTGKARKTALKPAKPPATHRVEFHEITPDAVRGAFEHPRAIDMRLVDAQQGRRVLDRLVGYKISPILWRKIRRGLSAGRVQSVALRMVVDREREILAFVPQEYWSIDVDLAKPAGAAEPSVFTSRLAGMPGGGKPDIGAGVLAESIVGDLRAAEYSVREVRQRQQKRTPAPPFTTSTLQQEASRRFGFTAKRTMAVAQALYEGLNIPDQGQVGLITYMRTDSLNVAKIAQDEARSVISGKYGADFVPEQPRFYKTKTKGAQEAHEAIRPTAAAREPSQLKGALTPDQLKLYTLVWQRFVASQMADALFDQLSVDIDGRSASQADPYLLRATASHMRFAGFRQVYIEGRDSDEDEDAERSLPELVQGEPLSMVEVKPEQHFTEPPPRYTEATLVKALEENGIGRPSTYAPTLSTIQDRGYVKRDARTLRPQELGFVVIDLMTEYFRDIMDLGFTARMEEELDEVANGEREWPPVVREIYEPLLKDLEIADKDAPKVEEETDEVCEKCERKMIKRWGRFGQFLACSGFPECRNTRPLEGDGEPTETDEKCGECESAMVVKRGRFGAFLACSRYPECTGSRPILKKVGVACPKDGGDIVEKKSKKGRTFYSCANYPDCDFTSWSRPQPQPCPSCGGLVVVGARESVKCTQCDWKGAAEDLAQPELAKASA